VLGLGGCCGGVAVAAAAVSPAAKRSGEGAPEAKQQREVGDEKMAGREEMKKKRDHQKDPPIVVHQFPFHSRPGLLWLVGSPVCWVSFLFSFDQTCYFWSSTSQCNYLVLWSRVSVVTVKNSIYIYTKLNLPKSLFTMDTNSRLVKMAIDAFLNNLFYSVHNYQCMDSQKSYTALVRSNCLLLTGWFSFSLHFSVFPFLLNITGTWFSFVYLY